MFATEVIKSLSTRVDWLEKQYDLLLQQLFVLTSSSINNSQFRSVLPPPPPPSLSIQPEVSPAATFIHSQSAAPASVTTPTHCCCFHSGRLCTELAVQNIIYNQFYTYSHLPFTTSGGAPVPLLPIAPGVVPVPSLEMRTRLPHSSPCHPPIPDLQTYEQLLDLNDVIKRYPSCSISHVLADSLFAYLLRLTLKRCYWKCLQLLDATTNLDYLKTRLWHSKRSWCHFPQFISSPIEFETYWTKCVGVINHCSANLCTKDTQNQSL